MKEINNAYGGLSKSISRKPLLSIKRLKRGQINLVIFMTEAWL